MIRIYSYSYLSKPVVTNNIRIRLRVNITIRPDTGGEVQLQTCCDNLESPSCPQRSPPCMSILTSPSPSTDWTNKELIVLS